MSALRHFARAAANQAFPVIGAEALRIDGGDGLNAVWDEEETNRDFISGGQQEEITISAVVRAEEFTSYYPDSPSSYEGKPANRGTTTYRVATIRVGDSFAHITLSGQQQAP